MGVKGLQSFLKKNEDYLSEKIILNNTTLVIDANNLLCSFYATIVLDRESPYYRSDVYGGDLVYYAKYVRAFFDNLTKCNITAILVFDGSVIGKSALREFVASKEKETRQRGLEKFRRAQVFKEQPVDEEILLPQTINTIFRNVATELDVKRIQTAYEADTHLARLANEYNCPVLTNDSDFIIFALKQGFILLDWFEHKTPVRGHDNKLGIKCSLFSQRKMSKSIPGLRPECLPLLSVILGNDYVEPGTFDQVVESICNRGYNGFLHAGSFTHRRIANMLIWLRQRSLNEAIDYILGLVHHRHQGHLRKLLTMFMRNYNIEESSDLDKELDEIYVPSRQLSDKDELQPREYLKRLMESDDLGSIALDIIFHNTHYNYTIVDDFRLPSSGFIRFRPLSLALVLLRPQAYSNLTTYNAKILSERDSFHIYDRLKGEYTRLVVRPMEELENFGSLQHLDCYSMILLEPTTKKNMLMWCFHFNSEEYNLMIDTVSLIYSGTYVEEVCICMLLIKYIGIECKAKPKPEFVDALLLTAFFYAACSGNLNIEQLPDTSAYGHLLLKLREHSFKVNKRVYKHPDNDIYRRIVHFISQLQVAYKAYVMLNSLFDHPLHKTDQGKFSNFTLIYRLTKMFRIKQEKLDELCKDIPTFVDACDTIKTLVDCC